MSDNTGDVDFSINMSYEDQENSITRVWTCKLLFEAGVTAPWMVSIAWGRDLNNLNKHTVKSFKSRPIAMTYIEGRITDKQIKGYVTDNRSGSTPMVTAKREPYVYKWDIL